MPFYCKVTRALEELECSHRSCAEMRVLIPAGVETLRPKCVLCGNLVPAQRATGRSKETCSPACGRVWLEWKKYNLSRRKCPNCMHPNTPEERKDFIAWRRARGDKEEKRGRPPVKRVVVLEESLREAVTLLRQARPDLMTVDAQEGAIARFENLIDGRVENVGTLAPSGQATQGEDHGSVR